MYFNILVNSWSTIMIKVRNGNFYASHWIWLYMHWASVQCYHRPCEVLWHDYVKLFRKVMQSINRNLAPTLTSQPQHLYFESIQGMRFVITINTKLSRWFSHSFGTFSSLYVFCNGISYYDWIHFYFFPYINTHSHTHEHAQCEKHPDPQVYISNLDWTTSVGSYLTSTLNDLWNRLSFQEEKKQRLLYHFCRIPYGKGNPFLKVQ